METNITQTVISKLYELLSAPFNVFVKIKLTALPKALTFTSNGKAWPLLDRSEYAKIVVTFINLLLIFLCDYDLR